MPKKKTTKTSANSANKTLVIAEKPSVAGDIARALGGLSRQGDFFEGDGYIVASAVGHMLELVAPEGSEPKRGKWSLANLPVLPDYFDLQPISQSEKRLRQLTKLYKRRDVVSLVNACDAGREGELIFHYLLRHFAGQSRQKSVQRLWLQSMTQAAIRDGFARLRDDAAMQPLQRAAVCRNESDWLIGINATRAMTALNSGGGGFSLTTVGRVQTPTLAILVDREKEIRAFTSRDYWEVVADFQIDSGQYQGRWIDPNFQAGKDAAGDGADGKNKDADGDDKIARAERIWDKARADEIVGKCEGQSGEASETTKPGTQRPPMLFDLTSLQRAANQRFGFSARATLAIAQALYERHKVLTYPRTDSRVLPEDYPATVNKTMQALTRLPAAAAADDGGAEKRGIGHWAKLALEKRYINGKDKRIFNNAGVSDHFAIIPTGELPRNLKPQEQRVYDLVARTFIAAFYPPARFQTTVRHTVVAGETFQTRGRVVVQPGWQAVMGRAAGGEALPALRAEKEAAETVAIAAHDKQTKPPARYSEATLLSAMEGAGKLMEEDELREAMQKRGLGTPATRAGIIEELLRVQYILRDARELVPTPKAMTLLRLLRALNIVELTQAKLTGEWEMRLAQIEGDQYSADEFMRDIRAMTKRIVAAASECKVDDIPGEYATLGAPCPKCGGSVREKYRKFMCDKCDFAMWKSMAGREFSLDEADTLLRERRVGPLDGFRGRKGGEFSAELSVTDNGTVAFDFAEREVESDEEVAAAARLGACPKCGGQVLDTARRYPCANSLGDGACDFNIGRQILSRPIAAEEVKQLLGEGKTALLAGFVSKRNRRQFSAHLTMDLHDKTGKLGFEFAPRKGGGEPAAGDDNADANKPGEDAGRVIHDFTEAGVRVLNGRYGPYITDGTKNISVPKGTQPSGLTLEECTELLKSAKPKRGRRGRRG